VDNRSKRYFLSLGACMAYSELDNCWIRELGNFNHRWHRFFNHEGTKKTKNYLIAARISIS
jgi:hypothetical protein